MENRENAEVSRLVGDILSDYQKQRDVDKMVVFNQPDRRAIKAISQKLLRIVFPGYYRDQVYKSYNLEGNLTVLIEDVLYNLSKQIAIVLKYDSVAGKGSPKPCDCASLRNVPADEIKIEEQAY